MIDMKVRDQIPEAIHFQNPPHPNTSFSRNGRQGCAAYKIVDSFAEPRGGRARCEVSCGWSEHVTTMEGTAHLVQHKPGIGDLPHLVLAGLGDVAEQPVIGTDEAMAAHLHQNRPACTTHTRIDDGDVNGPFGKPAPRFAQNKRRLIKIKWRYLMRNIDNANTRRDTEHDSFHRANKVIRCAEIGD